MIIMPIYPPYRFGATHQHHYTISLESKVPGELRAKCNKCEDILVVRIIAKEPSEEERLAGA